MHASSAMSYTKVMYAWVQSLGAATPLTACTSSSPWLTVHDWKDSCAATTPCNILLLGMLAKCMLTDVPKVDSHSAQMGYDIVMAVLQCQPSCLGGFRAGQGHGLESPRHAKMNMHNLWCFGIPKKVE